MDFIKIFFVFTHLSNENTYLMQEFYNFCNIFCVHSVSRLCKPDHILLKIRPRPITSRGPCLELWKLGSQPTDEPEFLLSCIHDVELRACKIKMLVKLERLHSLKYLLDQCMIMPQKLLKTNSKINRMWEKELRIVQWKTSRMSETRRPYQVWPVITVFPDADSRCTEPAVDDPSPSL